MRSLFTIGGLSPTYGGPSYSVPALASALARTGVETELFTCKPSQGQSAPKLPPTDLVKTHFLPLNSRSTRWLPQSNPFVSALRKSFHDQKDCVIHDNGIWLPTNHAAAYAARKLKCPLIISPRGMLTLWALQQRKIFKFVAWNLYQKRDLQSATVLHATSIQEAEEFRALGLKPPIAIIPNGVDLPTISPQSSILNPQSSSRTILYLGRIHPKKGLIDLVRASAQLQADFRSLTSDLSSQWRIIIAGEDDGGHLEQVKAESRKLKVEKQFEFVGAVEGKAKWELYRSADLFILPSHSENFGLVVAEALASGIPIITTRGTPWEELVTHRCGWWIEKNPESLAEALRDAMSRTDEERREMGERGRHLIEQKYTWPAVAAQMKSVYEWVLGKAPKPNCVV